MSLSISGAIDSDPILGPRVRRASQSLEEIIGPTAKSVTGGWRLASDANNHQLVVLDLTDATGAHVETRFTPDELAHQGRTVARLYKIWGDLLQDRSHQQLNQISGNINIS